MRWPLSSSYLIYIYCTLFMCGISQRQVKVAFHFPVKSININDWMFKYHFHLV